MIIFTLPNIFSFDNEQNAFFLSRICKKPPPKRGLWDMQLSPNAGIYSVKPSNLRHQVYLLIALCTALPQ